MARKKPTSPARPKARKSAKKISQYHRQRGAGNKAVKDRRKTGVRIRRNPLREKAKAKKKRSAAEILSSAKKEREKMIRIGKRRTPIRSWEYVRVAAPQLSYQANLRRDQEIRVPIPELDPEFYPKAGENENLHFLRISALIGDPDARYELGIRLASGIGLPKDNAQAVSWLNKSADSGSIHAQFSLGYIHDIGDIVRADRNKTLTWYEKAAVSGSIEAKLNLSRYHYLEGNNLQALKWWKELADEGHPTGQNNLATCLALGIGIGKDARASAELFRLSQAEGNYIAEYNYGICHQNGEGVSRSDSIAKALIESSANKGYHQAQYHLADCYLSGKMVNEKNNGLAIKWLNMAHGQMLPRKSYSAGYCFDLRVMGRPNERCRNNWAQVAADLGDTEAQSYLGRCYAYGVNVEKDYKSAIRWLTMAAVSDDAIAQYLLGCCHHKGLGTKTNTNRGAEWQRLAAINGLNKAIVATAHNYRHGKGVIKNDVEAYAFCCAAGKAHQRTFLESKKYDWKDFKAGEHRAKELAQEIADKREVLRRRNG
jgi:TPR repeat protein